MVTPFEELDAVLADFTGAVRDILGDNFVGAYVQGSFALGAGDMNSGCEFIIATTALLSGSAEAELRRLHNEIRTRAGFWTKHLEGSYADITSLRDVDGIGVEWLFCDHGHCRADLGPPLQQSAYALDPQAPRHHHRRAASRGPC